MVRPLCVSAVVVVTALAFGSGDAAAQNQSRCAD